MNQSINRANSDPVKQSMNQTINQATHKANNQPIKIKQTTSQSNKQ
jgi:hypothetical protein